MRQSSSQNSDAVSQKLKELEIERRTLKSRLDQVEQDMYKARTEKTEAIKARDGLAVELITAKKAKEDVDKQLADALQQITALKAQTEGTPYCLTKLKSCRSRSLISKPSSRP